MILLSVCLVFETGSFSVAQVGLEFGASPLPQPLQGWDCRDETPDLALMGVLFVG